MLAYLKSALNLRNGMYGALPTALAGWATSAVLMTGLLAGNEYISQTKRFNANQFGDNSSEIDFKKIVKEAAPYGAFLSSVVPITLYPLMRRLNTPKVRYSESWPG